MSARSILRFIFVLALLIGISLSLASYATSMAIGTRAFFMDEEGIEIGRRVAMGIPVYYFLFLVWEVPFGLRVDAIFAAILLIYTVAFAGAFLIGKRFDRAVRDSFKQPLAGSFRNWLFSMPVVTSMLFITIVLLTLLQESQGLETGSIEVEDPYLFFFNVSYAPIVEELGFRIVPLGTFLILHALIFNRPRFANLSGTQILSTLASAYLLPDRFRRNLGLNTVERVGFRRSIRASDWIIILLTAFSFGLAHYISGGGWGLGKISQTFVSGMVLGPIFLLYGAPAPILTHWMFNFYLSSYTLAPESWFILPLLSILITGAVGWLGAIGQAGRIVWRRVRGTPRTRGFELASAAYCSQCGAQFDNGAAFCTNCGARRTVI